MGLGIIIAVNGTPDPELAEASRVEVYECLGETTYFTVSYPADIHDGDLDRLKDTRLGPGSVLAISAEVNDQLECLVVGPVYSQQIHLEHGGAGSSVEVKGADSSIKMDREFRSVVWTDVSDGEAVTSILGNYSLTPDVATTATRHLDAKHSLVQRETDLRFIRRLARRNGCYFWLTSSSATQETAHFQRPALGEEPVAELTINFASPTIQAFDVTWNVERPTSVEGQQLDLNTKHDIDGALAQSPQNLLGTKSLLDLTAAPRSIRVAAPTNDAGDMQARSEGALIEADWFIRATCRTSLHQLGKLVRIHTVVSVRGAGSRHSGNYYVAGVRHTIDATAHLMELELIRNAWNEAQNAGQGLASTIF